jgi:aspartyl protease family protein
MLRNALLFAASASVLVWFAPSFLPLSPTVAPLAASSRVATEAPPSPAPDSEGYRVTTVSADRGGQYSVDVLIDGESTPMLVDTGATMVAISADLAARLGYAPEPGKPKWTVRTANGDSFASPVTLRSVSVGSIYLNDVAALVLDRSAGDVNLLGESFLARLEGVEQRGGRLILRQ